MKPVSPRDQCLPAFAKKASGGGNEKAKALEAAAKVCTDNAEMDEAEACLRAAFNAWVAAPEYDKERIPALQRILRDLVVLLKGQDNIADALKMSERWLALEDHLRKKTGGLGGIETLVLNSEVLTLSNRPEEAADAAKRAIDLMFRKYSNSGDVSKLLSRDELVQFGAAWQSLAVAEEFLLHKCTEEGTKSLGAVEALVHYRRGVKCFKDLLGDDPATVSAERKYAAAKKTIGKFAAAAPADRMPPVVAAYPGDKSAPPPSTLMIAASESGGAAGTGKSPRPTGLLPALVVDHLNAAASPGMGKSPQLRSSGASSTRSRDLSDASENRRDPFDFKSPFDPSKQPSPRQAVSSARNPSLVVTTTPRRRSTISKLEPLPPSAIQPTAKRDSFVLHSPREAQDVSYHMPPSIAKPEPPKPKIPQGMLTSNTKKGLQLLFFTAETKRRPFLALRSVYLFTRELSVSFPHFNLAGQKTLTTGIQANEHRLDAMQYGINHTKLEAEAAERVRRKKELQEMVEKKRRPYEVELFADMDRQTQRNARRYKVMMTALTAFLQNLDRFVMRQTWNKWMAFLGPRRRMRPLRRAAAHLFKQVDRQLLRRRFIVWLRWLREKKRSVFATGRRRSMAQNEGIQRSLKMIQDQEAEMQADRDREDRRREADEQDARHKSEMEALKEHLTTMANRDTAHTGVAPPESPQRLPSPLPEMPVTTFVEVQVPEALRSMHEVVDNFAGDVSRMDACKQSFVEVLHAYEHSESYHLELRRLDRFSDDDRERLTEVVRPLLVSFAEDEDYFSDVNREVCRSVLATLYPWIDFHHIFFEDEVLLSAAKSGHEDIVELLLTAIPNFEVQSHGTYLYDLVVRCVRHESRPIHLMETLLLKCEGALPFHEATSLVSPLMMQFFERWVPSPTRAIGRRGSVYGDPATEAGLRARGMTLFERVLLDIRSFHIVHDQELSDRHTLMSRMCGNGDVELFELYCSLVDENTTRALLHRTQSDGTNCLVQAVRSRSLPLVSLIVTEHESAVTDQLCLLYDGMTITEIAKQRGCSAELVRLLVEHGAPDPDDRPGSSASSPASVSRRSGGARSLLLYDAVDAFANKGPNSNREGDTGSLPDEDEERGDGASGGIDHLLRASMSPEDDLLLHSNRDGDAFGSGGSGSGRHSHISFSSPPIPPDSPNNSFRRV